ncbi:hypothetical protein GCK72_021124 [Caenorhabditis remanei]|uniref:DUF38 domain-containing protein n=1 Tax=Caenorhabditis remanei TaxID=31234 RepID=A0A6A5GIX1_CAERE|nr:hypothetical protein GCK72_021124 [Caenorhabditis remanei]KAF1754561.1 hypothetical protein GCK72_021124 [Caenorhabditis remanei]
MPLVYDSIDTLYKRDATRLIIDYNDQKATGTILLSPIRTENYKHVGDPARHITKSSNNKKNFYYKQVEGSAGASTLVEFKLDKHEVDEYFMSVVCEDVEAFVRNKMNQLTKLILTALDDTYKDEQMLKTNINRMCQCLENSLKLRTEKLKVERIGLSVLEISQAVSAVNLLDREVLWLVTVHLPFDDQVFTAEDFIPLIEGQGRQRLDLRILLNEFSLQLLEEVRKLLTYTSKLNSITICYQTIDEKCIELIAETEHSSNGEYFFKFSIDHADDPTEEMATLTLSDNKRHLNIFEIPSIMSQLLRKVSRGIRHCVDYIKPDPHIRLYQITIRSFSVVVGVDHGLFDQEIIQIHQGSLEQQAVRIVNDFYLYTRHQNTCMEFLAIGMNKSFWKIKEEEKESVMSTFFKGMRDVLISRTSPLKVNLLILNIHLQCLVMDILPYLDAEYLDSIRIWKIEEIDEESTIDLDEIVKTEQWSKAKKLWIKDLTVRMSIQEMNILNFGSIRIIVETMSREDITYCRKNLPQSPVFQNFKIHINNCSTEDFLTALGGPYRVVDDFEYIWYFRIENTQYYLYVALEQGPLQIEGCSYFEKIHQDKTPFFL